MVKIIKRSFQSPIIGYNARYSISEDKEISSDFKTIILWLSTQEEDIELLIEEHITNLELEKINIEGVLKEISIIAPYYEEKMEENKEMNHLMWDNTGFDMVRVVNMKMRSDRITKLNKVVNHLVLINQQIRTVLLIRELKDK